MLSTRLPKICASSPAALQAQYLCRSLGRRRPSAALSAQVDEQVHSTREPAPQNTTSVIDYSKGFDTNYFHYQPWWVQPPVVIAVGLALVVGANMCLECTIKTTILAGGPVALWWYILLVQLPQQFKKFASNYMKTHDVSQQQK